MTIYSLHINLRKSLGLILFVFSSCFLFAQQSEQAFLEAYAEKGAQEFFYKNSRASSGGYLYVAGASINDDGNYDMLLTKYSGSTEIWSVSWNGTAEGDDYAADVLVDGSGNIYICGTSEVSSTNYNAVVVKYNSSGTFQWASSYAGAAGLADGFVSIAVDGSGNIYSTGGTQTTTELTNFLTVKYNSSGTQQWASTYDYMDLQDLAVKILVSGSQVRVSGGAQGSSTSWKMATVAYNASTGAQGTVMTTGGDDEGIDLVADAWTDGVNTYVIGSVVNSGDYDWKVLKLDSNLTVTWSVTYDGPDGLDDRANGVKVDDSGNVYVTGYYTDENESKNFMTRKYNSSGTIQWASSFNENTEAGDDQALTIETDASGHVIVSGSSYKDGNKDYFTIKYKYTDGTEVWRTRFNSDYNDDDVPSNIALDESGNIYVIGTVGKGDGTTTYMMCKYSVRTIYMPVPTDEFSASGGYVTNRGQVRNTDATSNTAIKFHNNRNYPSTYLDNRNFSMVFAHCHEDTIAPDTLHRISMKFNKGNTNAPVYPLKERGDYINYYLPFMTSKGERTSIFDMVVKPSVYTNTDVYYAHNNRGYVHYIVCRPGSPTTDIEMEFSGQSSISVDGSGNLFLETIFGNHTQQKAKVYTMNNTTGVLTLLSWQPEYAVSGNYVSFTNIGSWSGTLVIKMEQQPAGGAAQPMNIETLEWSSYMGGNDDDMATDVACNSEQTSWYTGRTNSVNIPLLEGVTISLQEGDFNSLYVAKYSQDLHAEWFVVYGEDAMGRSLIYDLEGNIYAVGTSIAGENHAPEGLNLSATDDTDGILCVFNVDGVIQCDTYIGGNGADTPYSIDVIRNAIDGTTDIWIAGTTNSNDLFPLQNVTGAYNQDDAGNWDGFLMKIVDSETIEWATMFGGNDADRIYELDIYRTSLTEYDIILIGVTYTEQHSIQNSANPLCDVPTDGSFPTCQPAGSWLQPTYANSDFIYPNYFVSRFSGSNFNLKWSTYFGMASDVSNVFYREGSIISTTINDSFYITGSAGEYNNASFPIVASGNTGSYNQAFAGGDADMFIAKFLPNNNLVWSTFFGSDEDYEFASSLAFVPSNNFIVVTGTTEATNLQSESEFCDTAANGEFPLCDANGNNYMESVVSGPRRTVIAAFNASDQLQWSTLFGDGGTSNGMSLDAAGSKLYLSGMADDGYTFLEYDENSDLDYYQDFQFGNDNDAGLARFDLSLITTIEESKGDVACPLVVYPNPSHGLFQLALPTQVANNNWSYQIFDVIGQMVTMQTKKGNSGSILIDLSDMASGVYLLTFHSEGIQYNLQLVKQ